MKKFTDIYREILTRNIVSESIEDGLYLSIMIDDPTYFIEDQMKYERFLTWIGYEESKFFSKYSITYYKESLDDEYGTVIICAKIKDDLDLQSFLSISCPWSENAMSIREYLEFPEELNVNIEYMKENSVNDIEDIGQYIMSDKPLQGMTPADFYQYIKDEMHNVYFYLDNPSVKKRMFFMAPELHDEEYDRNMPLEPFEEKYNLTFQRQSSSKLNLYSIEFNNATELKDILSFEILPNMSFAKLLSNDLLTEAVKNNNSDDADDYDEESDDDEDPNFEELDKDDEDSGDDELSDEELISLFDKTNEKTRNSDDEYEKFEKRMKAKANKPTTNVVDRKIATWPENECITRLSWIAGAFDDSIQGSFKIIDVN